MMNALNLLKGKARVRRMMWSRKAQEYLNKINSGDPILISEVIRDLYKKNNQPEPSYSERQMFQSAIERLARELAAVEKIDHFSATEKIESIRTSQWAGGNPPSGRPQKRIGGKPRGAASSALRC